MKFRFVEYGQAVQHDGYRDTSRRSLNVCTLCAGHLVPISGLAGADDDAFCMSTNAGSVQSFANACKVLQHWPREAQF